MIDIRSPEMIAYIRALRPMPARVGFVSARVWAVVFRTLAAGYHRRGAREVARASRPGPSAILAVPRTREEAREAYDTLSKFYDYTTGALGRRYTRLGLTSLSIAEGETVLEIGFGTGRSLQLMADRVGAGGKAYGLDLSAGMIRVAAGRLRRAGLAGRVGLCCGDALHLPFREGVFDAVFMSFVLEVLDTPEIPEVLVQVKKALKPGGRLGVTSMSKEKGETVLIRLYEWAHGKWPKYLGSRPIYAHQCLVDAGYLIRTWQKIRIFRLPAEIVVAVRPGPGGAVQAGGRRPVGHS